MARTRNGRDPSRDDRDLTAARETLAAVFREEGSLARCIGHAHPGRLRRGRRSRPGRAAGGLAAMASRRPARSSWGVAPDGRPPPGDRRIAPRRAVPGARPGARARSPLRASRTGYPRTTKLGQRLSGRLAPTRSRRRSSHVTPRRRPGPRRTGCRSCCSMTPCSRHQPSPVIRLHRADRGKPRLRCTGRPGEKIDALDLADLWGATTSTTRRARSCCAISAASGAGPARRRVGALPDPPETPPNALCSNSA